MCVCVRERFFVLFFRKHQYLLYSFLSMLFSLRGMYTQCHITLCISPLSGDSAGLFHWCYVVWSSGAQTEETHSN